MESGLAKLVASFAQGLDRRFGWDRLPRPLGLLTLYGIRMRLRARNLYDTGIAHLPNESIEPPQNLVSRTLDGSWNDLTQPAMGSIGSRFGRNVPVERTYPEEESSLLDPNPRLVSRELLTRDTFIPATTLNVLAAAWLQFEVHDWFSHGKNETDNPWELSLDPPGRSVQ